MGSLITKLAMPGNRMVKKELGFGLFHYVRDWIGSHSDNIMAISWWNDLSLEGRGQKSH